MGREREREVGRMEEFGDRKRDIHTLKSSENNRLMDSQHAEGENSSDIQNFVGGRH